MQHYFCCIWANKGIKNTCPFESNCTVELLDSGLALQTNSSVLTIYRSRLRLGHRIVSVLEAISSLAGNQMYTKFGK